MTKKNNINVNINVNITDSTIEVSKAFLKKASVFGSEEYLALKEARAAEPTFKVKEVLIKKNTNKQTYSSLTFKAMAAHIELIETDEKVRKNTLNEMKEIEAYGKARGSAYPIVKKWFLQKYKDTYNDLFEKDEKNDDKKEEKTDTAEQGNGTINAESNLSTLEKETVATDDEKTA